jgi:tetratricopeptide (TPR) repeat protein
MSASRVTARGSDLYRCKPTTFVMMLVLQGVVLQTGNGPFADPPSLDEMLGPSTEVTGIKREQDAQERTLAPLIEPPTRRGPPATAPREAEAQAAQHKIREAFAAEIAAARDSAGQAKLIAQLLEVADDPGLDHVNRFAIVEVALAEATRGAEPALVREALQARSEWFADQDSVGPMVGYLKEVTEKTLGDAAIMLTAALEVSQQAMDAGRPVEAEAAITIAKAQLLRVPAHVADRLRPAVQSQELRAVEMLNVFRDADTATKVLAESPADPVGNLRAGFRSVWAGDWDKAKGYFARGQNHELKAAAMADLALPEDPDSSALFAIAGKWWAAAAGPEETRNALDAELPIRPSQTVREAIKHHASALYRRALESLPGITNPIDRKLAESRIEQATDANKKQRYLVTESQRVGTPPEEIQAAAKSQLFDEAAFVNAEAEISELFKKLGRISAREPGAVERLHRQLTTVRQRWCEALHLYNRDTALVRRQQLVSEMLGRQPDFGDAWLCDCYLKILDGKAVPAQESLKRAVDLMNKDPVRQVYCGQQILDAGNAALLLGDRQLADKLKNFLKARVPNHPGVKLYQAMMYVDKSMFSEALSLLDEVMKDTTGLDRSVVAADYAWLKAAVSVDRLRDPAKAKNAVRETLAAESGPHWKAWRAEAALLAADAKWDEAIVAIDKATVQAPLLFASELDRQRKAYIERRQYWIERK